MTLEIAPGGHVVMLREKRSIFRPQHRLDVGQRPDVELSLFALRIGVQGRVERALPAGHLPREPTHSLLGPFPVQHLSGAAPGERQQVEKLGIVVEHLLEMRHQPLVVDRIARIAAAEMVVDAALADLGQGQVHDVEEAPLPGPQSGPPELLEHRALRKFRRAAQAAVHRVHGGAELLRRPGPAPAARW